MSSAEYEKKINAENTFQKKHEQDDLHLPLSSNQLLRAKPKDKLPPVKGRMAVLAGKTDNRLPLLAPRVQRRRDHLNIGLVTTIMMIVMMMMMITIA